MRVEDIIFSTDVRRAEGGTSRLLRSARTGSLAKIRRGAYLDADEWGGLDPVSRHRLQSLAFLRSAHGGVVFCGETAAVLLGIPLIGAPPDRPIVAVTPRTTCTDAGAIRRAIMLDPDEVVRVAGVLVTSPLRTAMDVGAARGPEAAVIALSDIARRWGVTTAAMAAFVVSRRPFRGVRAIDAALPAVSPLSETPIESLGMLRFWQAGFELPEQQVAFRIRKRHYRADYWWRRAGVVGEADGRLKYATPEDLWEEKIREDDLRSLARGFIRLNWSDLQREPVVRAALIRVGVPRRGRACDESQGDRSA